METAKTSTTLTMLLLLLWVLFCGTAIGSPLQHELQMLEMMQNILGVDGSNLGDLSQRDSPMRFASSVPCDDSLPDESVDNLSLFDEQLDESVECGDFGDNCDEEIQLDPGLEPCPNPLIPVNHPCFVRVMILRTPMMRQDPCKNFTLSMARTETTTTSTTKKPKTKKCKPRKKVKSSGATKAAGNSIPKSTTMTTSPTTTNSEEETESSAETTTTTALPTVHNTTIFNTESTTENTTIEEDTTTLEWSTTTAIKTTEDPSTALFTKNKLRSNKENPDLEEENEKQKKKKNEKRNKKKNKGNKKPRVPDPPKIKIDGAMLPSDALSVFQSTEVSEIKSRKLTTEAPEETTTDCVEDASYVESDEINRKANNSNETEEASITIEDCDEIEETKANENIEDNEEVDDNEETENTEEIEDTEDQDTNLCPQFSPPEEAANMRAAPGSRYRKPFKNYVEPILYEGQFSKPRQRIGTMLPPTLRRDYFVSNKQIMPRPRPKLREPMPHSIYMNNIVRGLKCSDKVDSPPHVRQPKRYRIGKPTTPQRVWLPRHHGAGYLPVGTPASMLGHQRRRVNPFYALHSGEELDHYEHDSEQYYDDGNSERLPWHREQSMQTAMPSVDPCQAEHRQQREKELHREHEDIAERDRGNEHSQDFAQPRFFT